VYETQRNANVRELEIKGEIGNSVSQLKWDESQKLAIVANQFLL
jgi:hypothetical protein